MFSAVTCNRFFFCWAETHDDYQVSTSPKSSIKLMYLSKLGLVIKSTQQESNTKAHIDGPKFDIISFSVSLSISSRRRWRSSRRRKNRLERLQRRFLVNSKLLSTMKIWTPSSNCSTLCTFLSLSLIFSFIFLYNSFCNI